MIQIISIIVAGIILFIMSILDLRHKKVPAFLSSFAIMFLIVAVIYLNANLIVFGVLGFAFAWFLYDFDFIRGVADIKAILIISLLIRSLPQFFVFMLLTVMVGLAYQVFMIRLLHKDVKKISDFFKIKEEVPFVPVFMIVFVLLEVITYFAIK